MKIENIHIKNFRAFKDCQISFDDYTCFVGANGVGKSTLLTALNIFFLNQDNTPTDCQVLSDEDFHQKNTSEPIEIKVTFGGLSKEACEDLKHYVRNDKLIVKSKAVFTDGKATVRQYGSRTGIRDFAAFFEAPNATAKNTIYSSLQSQYDLPNVSSAPKRGDELNKYENTHPDKCEEIESETQFYGISKGKNLLEKHIQWIYVPAVKDAVTEEQEVKNSALGKLLNRAVRSKVNFKDDLEEIHKDTVKKLQKLVEINNPVLNEISKSLQKKLTALANPLATVRMEWSFEPDKVKVEQPFARLFTGEQGFEGSISRFGHGLQRSYLIALLQELSVTDSDVQPTLLLGIEEPELYQHPPQARHLSGVLQKLATGNSQVVCATHSPYFVTGRGFETVRLIRRREDDNAAYCCHLSFDELATSEANITGKQPAKPIGVRAQIDPLLQPSISEMLFTQKLVLVEGLEDLAIISNWLVITRKDEFARKNGINIVPVGCKSNMLRPALIARGLEIPTLIIFDADGNCDKKYHNLHKADNEQPPFQV